jgi:GAF domain-containing protein
MSKQEQYNLVIRQAEALFSDESNTLANMSNLCSLLHHSFGFWWTGFYMIENDQLVLGPFQGPVACTRIDKGKGVCGTAWAENKTQIVPNVHEFEGHIACSAESNSEIVLPVVQRGDVIGVLDIDSKEFDTFDEIDAENLQKLLALIWS